MLRRSMLTHLPCPVRSFVSRNDWLPPRPCSHLQVGLLLEAAPDAALARTSTGPSPLWMACALGHTAVARQLLAAAPQTATMLAGISTTPLHAAVEQGHLDIVQLILQVQPLAATVVSRQGSLALHLAASANHPCSAAMVRLLLAAAPGTAAAVRVPADATLLPYTALHLAAIEGNAAAARLLVQAAPQVCLMQVGPQSDLPPESVWPLDSELPLQTALSMAAAAQHHQQGAPSGPPSRLKPVAAYLDTANAMLAAMPPDTSLPLLARFADVALPLFPTIAAHWPLTAAQWQQVPTPSPGLGSALPATLQRSEAEAALLVARLPAADAARLRAFALALHGTQQQLDSVLPAHISARILSLFDA